MSQRKIKWKPLKDDPSQVSTEDLDRTIAHNTLWIEFEAGKRYARDGGCAAWEESQYDELAPYAEELERRKEVNNRQLETLDPTKKYDQLRFPVRMAKPIKDELDKRAKEWGLSVNACVVHFIIEGLKKK